MVKKVFAVLALAAFVAVIVDVFFIRYALEIVLPVYIIAMIAGIILVVFNNAETARRKAAEARNAEEDEKDIDRLNAADEEIAAKDGTPDAD